MRGGTSPSSTNAFARRVVTTVNTRTSIFGWSQQIIPVRTSAAARTAGATFSASSCAVHSGRHREQRAVGEQGHAGIACFTARYAGRLLSSRCSNTQVALRSVGTCDLPSATRGRRAPVRAVRQVCRPDCVSRPWTVPVFAVFPRPSRTASDERARRAEGAGRGPPFRNPRRGTPPRVERRRGGRDRRGCGRSPRPASRRPATRPRRPPTRSPPR